MQREIRPTEDGIELRVRGDETEDWKTIKFDVEEGGTLNLGQNPDGTIKLRTVTPDGTDRSANANPGGGSEPLGQP